MPAAARANAAANAMVTASARAPPADVSVTLCYGAAMVRAAIPAQSSTQAGFA
jgi:hypothetical protein